MFHQVVIDNVGDVFETQCSHKSIAFYSSVHSASSES